MILVTNILFLIIGFIGLIKGADIFVDGSAGLAKKLRIPSVIIGLTIVAMGTSAPELCVSVTSALKGSSEISISNVVGSNIFNLLMVLGICAIISNVPIESDIIKRDFPFVSSITMILLAFPLLGGLKKDRVSSAFKSAKMNRNIADLGVVAGIVFLVLFVVYLVILIKAARKNRETTVEEIKAFPLWKCLLFIVVGAVLIIAGGQFVVNSAQKIARIAGISETLIGLTIIAVGTSLPELVTSIVASRKGENGLAVGNAVGSCIFNILLIIGVASVITPISVNLATVIDIAVLLVITLITFVFSFTKRGISRTEGIAMVAIYVGEVVFAIIR
ncbi:MAG: calcium/sodium antiporter [Lachnospiraceae bacterium]|nr:calcium/sodium antiporter [Lachnospiraceae bacterium]